MGNHVGRGRYLTEKNFSKELYLEFNLGPLFLRGNLAEKIFNLKKKDYVYKKYSSGQLATRYSHLVDCDEDAAVSTKRRLQEEKAHMPTDIWNMW